jgi:tetratricopeptide (TPR) repeat protein
MAGPTAETSERDDLLDQVLGRYLAALDAGETPDRAELLARYPELQAYFAEQDDMEQWMAPLRAVSQSAHVDTTIYTSQGSPSEQPASGAPAPEPTFGSYKLLAPIGRGGMGVIWKALDQRLNRVVALKMLLSSDPSPLDLQRFRNEAEAAALLDHPHIVPIYEVGERDGQMFFSMKLVEGGSLAAHLAEFRRRPQDAARVLAEVARAVHYAHQRGILHRDLKPGNILLEARQGGAEPHQYVPLVTDFGLAKRLGAQELTQPGALIGTPGYMAPEQARGHQAAVTTASDIYGLGAVLYALLTGSAPFAGDDLLRTLEQVRTREPEPPRSRNPLVPRDLELICLKCLDKEPQRRYASAAALADELDRFRAGKPLVQTRPVGNAERLWRWFRRNPVLGSLAAAVVLLLASVAVIASVGYYRLKTANEREHASRLRAEDNLQVAREAVAYFADLSEQPQMQKRGLENLRREMRRRARDFYTQLVRQQPNDARLEAERGQAFVQLGRMNALLGAAGDAVAAHRQAEQIFADLCRKYPGVPGYEEGLAQALLEQGLLYQLSRQFPDARRVLDEALPIRKRLADEHPDVPAYQERLSRALHHLARFYQVTRQTGTAQKTYEEAQHRLEQLLAAQGSNRALYAELLAGTHINLGTLLLDRGDVPKARAHYETARDLLSPFDAENPGNPRRLDLLAEAHHLLGSLERGRSPERALPAYDASLKVLQRLTRDHPDVPDYQFHLGSVYHARGYALLLMAQKDSLRNTDLLDEADAWYAKAAGVLEPLVRDYDEVRFPGERDRFSPAHFPEELGKIHYDWACLDSVQIAALKNAPREAALKEARAASHADLAVEHLRKAWTAWLHGYRDALVLLQQDSDLQALRQRPEFAPLLAEFTRELPPSKAPAPRP